MGCLVFKRSHDKITENIHSSLCDIHVQDIDGVQHQLKDYKDNNKAFIFVNVACK